MFRSSHKISTIKILHKHFLIIHLHCVSTQSRNFVLGVRNKILGGQSLKRQLMIFFQSQMFIDVEVAKMEDVLLASTNKEIARQGFLVSYLNEQKLIHKQVL